MLAVAIAAYQQNFLTGKLLWPSQYSGTSLCTLALWLSLRASQLLSVDLAPTWHWHQRQHMHCTCALDIAIRLRHSVQLSILVVYGVLCYSSTSRSISTATVQCKYYIVDSRVSITRIILMPITLVCILCIHTSIVQNDYQTLRR